MISRQQESRDIDPGEMVTAIMSGWGGGYHTSSNTPEGRKPVPLSAAEIINRLRELEALCNKSVVDFLTRTVANHVRDNKNPHNTDLTQFNTEIMHLLYELYLEQGNTGTFEFFYKELFQVFQIAGITDLRDGMDETMLATIAVVKKYISEHNRSLSAHSALFERLIPGVPVLTDPTFSMSANFQFPALYQSPLLDRWNYIGKDGFLYENTNNTLPIDYTFGEPMVPIFEDRENLCVFSNDLSRASWVRNKLLVGSTNGFSLDKLNRGTTVVETTDYSAHEHKATLKDLEIEEDTTYTASVVFLPEEAKYFAIRIKGTTFSPTDVAYFNVEKGTGIVGSTDGRFKADIVKLHSGACRMSITWRNTNSTLTDIEFIPYIDSGEGLAYRGRGRVLGTISGVQVEKGDGMSPIIHTSGIKTLRRGVAISVPLDSRFDMDKGTIVIEYRAPLPFDDDHINTLYAIRDTEGKMVCSAEYREPSALMFSLFDVFGSMIWDYPLENGTTRRRTVVQMYSDLTQIVAATGIVPKSTNTIGVRFKAGNVLDIGHNNGLNYLNGYVSKVWYYPTELTANNVAFLAGE